MFKHLLKSVMLVFVLAFASVALPAAGNPMTSVASAEDVWIYGTDNGTSYWVRTETVNIQKRTAEPYAATLKTVRNNACVGQTRWHFSEDGGYVWARAENSRDGFAISQGYYHDGNATVYYRPELLALYNWLKNY